MTEEPVQVVTGLLRAGDRITLGQFRVLGGEPADQDHVVIEQADDAEIEP